MGPDEGKREAAKRRPAACIALTHGPTAASKCSTLEDAGVVPTHHDDLPQGEEATRSLEAMLVFTQGTGHKPYAIASGPDMSLIAAHGKQLS